MTYEEAIFCEKSYLGETDCRDCKYYGTDTCLSRESHKMAVQALKECHTQEQTFEWCHDCKEYDHEAHCCHRWSKVIRTTVADIKTEMASEIIEQIEKMRHNELYHFLPNHDAYNLFQKIVEDYRDGKGAWLERKKND